MAPSLQDRSKLNRWLREPLLHFLLIGAVLFAIYATRSRNPSENPDTRRIVLTDDDLQQMTKTWRAQGFPEPSPAQMQNLVEAMIREEILYREALAMGLDKDDTIVKQRMAQKMDFLAEDLSALREPTREELQSWLQTHPDDFAFPPRITFQHLYFPFDEHGDKARADATAALSKIAGRPVDAPEIATVGDPFMFESSYTNRTPDQVGGVFGGKFKQALFELKPGAWCGPIESGFGWHLVFIDSLTPGRTPEFEEVEAEVKTQWLANQQAELKRQAYEAMRAKYEVILPTSANTN